MAPNLDENLMPSPARDDATPDPSPALLGYTADDDGDVCHHGQPLALPPKERAVLHLLLRQWPRTVSKEAFARQVWAGQAMSDESLARCVAQLRQAVPPATGLLLRAEYRRGYRLHVAVAGSAPATPQAPAHWRLVHAAMAPPHQVETLTHARQLVQQRSADALARAEQLLRALIAEAPEYHAAKLAFAECLAATVSCGLTVRRERIDEALSELARVETQAPQMPGLLAETAHLLDCAWRFDEAAVLHARALASSPLDAATHYYRGWHLLATDQPREAVQALEQALRLNPFSVYMAILLARALATAGDHEAALARARRTRENAPEHRAAALHLLGVQALVAPSSALATPALELLPEPASWVFAASTLGYVLVRCGEPEAAARVIASTDRSNPSEQATHAAALTLLGRRAEALDRLERAADEGCGHLPLVLLATENAALRDDPRWAALAARVWPRDVVST